MAGTVTNTFRSTSDDGDFALEIGRIIKVELLIFWHLLMSPLSKTHYQHIFSKTCDCGKSEDGEYESDVSYDYPAY